RPQPFKDRTGLPAKPERVPAVRFALTPLRPLQRQAVHAAPHVGRTARQPHPHPGRHRQHQRRSSTSSTRLSAATSTPASTMIRRPFVTTISIRLDDEGAAARSGTTTAGTNLAAPAT